MLYLKRNEAESRKGEGERKEERNGEKEREGEQEGGKEQSRERERGERILEVSILNLFFKIIRQIFKRYTKKDYYYDIAQVHHKNHVTQ